MSAPALGANPPAPARVSDLVAGGAAGSETTSVNILVGVATRSASMAYAIQVTKAILITFLIAR